MKFECQHDEHDPKVVMELSAQSTLPDVVSQFELFLKACGYVFDGQLDFVEDEEN